MQEGVPLLRSPRHRVQRLSGFFASRVAVNVVSGLSDPDKVAARECMNRRPRTDPFSGALECKARSRSRQCLVFNHPCRLQSSTCNVVDLDARRSEMPLFPLSCLCMGFVRHHACNAHAHSHLNSNKHRHSFFHGTPPWKLPLHFTTITRAGAIHFPNTCHEAVQAHTRGIARRKRRSFATRWKKRRRNHVRLQMRAKLRRTSTMRRSSQSRRCATWWNAT